MKQTVLRVMVAVLVVIDALALGWYFYSNHQPSHQPLWPKPSITPLPPPKEDVVLLKKATVVKGIVIDKDDTNHTLVLSEGQTSDNKPSFKTIQLSPTAEIKTLWWRENKLPTLIKAYWQQIIKNQTFVVALCQDKGCEISDSVFILANPVK